MIKFFIILALFEIVCLIGAWPTKKQRHEIIFPVDEINKYEYVNNATGSIRDTNSSTIAKKIPHTEVLVIQPSRMPADETLINRKSKQTVANSIPQKPIKYIDEPSSSTQSPKLYNTNLTVSSAIPKRNPHTEILIIQPTRMPVNGTLIKGKTKPTVANSICQKPIRYMNEPLFSTQSPMVHLKLYNSNLTVSYPISEYKRFNKTSNSVIDFFYRIYIEIGNRLGITSLKTSVG